MAEEMKRMYPNFPTMNLGQLDSMPTDKDDEKFWISVVLHEFGHALGFEHENPGNVPYDREKVLKYYRERGDGVSDERVERNLFQVEGIKLSEFDRDSIMSYKVDAELLDMTKPGAEKFVHGRNWKLSTTDKACAQKYYGLCGECS